MTPGAFEHGFFALVTLLLPLWALRQHRALVADLGTGRPDARVNAYRRTMALEWSLAILVVVRWGVRGQLPGALWAPILVHAVVDLNSGYLGRKVLGILPTSATPAV
jgi:hypothetical protein